MPNSRAFDQRAAARHLCPERRNKIRLLQDAKIEVRREKTAFSAYPVIESTRHGARLVMPGSTKKDEGVDFLVSIGDTTFEGQARVAWTVALDNGRSVVGLEFLTFRLAA